MKKIWIAGGVTVFLILGLIAYRWTHPSIAKKINTLQENLESYQLEATMQMMDGEDLKKFNVVASYQKIGEEDCFRVDLEDQSSHQQQKIIRNQDGVFVVAPALNRAFQFKSEWPFNSFKPYIMQSIIKIFDGEYESEKISDGYLVSAPLSYSSDPRVTHLEVRFDQELQLQNVTLYDENEAEIVMLDVTRFAWNPTLEKNLFTVQNDAATQSNVSFTDDLPLYPLEMLGNELVDQTTAEINGEEKHILRFSGDEHFTIIENSLTVSDEFVIEEVSGDLLEVSGALAFISDDVVTLFEGDMLCQVFSDALTTEQKLQVVSSMQNSVVNEP